MISLEQLEPKWTTCSSWTQKGCFCWFRRLEWCALHRTKNSLDERPSNRTKHLSQSSKGDCKIGGDPNRKEHEGRSPLYSYNAYKVQTPSGSDKLVTEQDTVPVLLQNFEMCFRSSFPDNWWCKSSQQAGETTQVAARETPIAGHSQDRWE